MKILVYGAGVLGCNLARNLLRAGKDVTLLARGNWAAEIKQNGLRIKDKFSPCVSVSRIPVVTELASDAVYDVIFVVLRYTQLDSVLDTLRANRTKNIVFVGNNVQARALAAALPGKNVLFAFALSAGHREVDRVVSIDLKKITIGMRLTEVRSENLSLIRRPFCLISAAQFPRASRVTSFPARSRFLARLHPRTPAPYTRIFIACLQIRSSRSAFSSRCPRPWRKIGKSR